MPGHDRCFTNITCNITCNPGGPSHQYIDEEICKQIKEAIQSIEKMRIKPACVLATKDVVDIIMSRLNRDYKVSDFSIATYDPNLFFINIE